MVIVELIESGHGRFIEDGQNTTHADRRHIGTAAATRRLVVVRFA
jgi:hypothetical protein